MYTRGSVEGMLDSIAFFGVGMELILHAWGNLKQSEQNRSIAGARGSLQ